MPAVNGPLPHSARRRWHCACMRWSLSLPLSQMSIEKARKCRPQSQAPPPSGHLLKLVHQRLPGVVLRQRAATWQARSGRGRSGAGCHPAAQGHAAAGAPPPRPQQGCAPPGAGRRARPERPRRRRCTATRRPGAAGGGGARWGHGEGGRPLGRHNHAASTHQKRRLARPTPGPLARSPSCAGR